MPRPSISPRLAVVYGIFLVSGAAGLIYEVTWTRELSYVFGSGTYALSAVVVAYMGGLALGGGLAGRFVARLQNPLPVYAALELGVAACGLVLPRVLSQLSFVDHFTHAAVADSFAALTASRFLATVAVLLLPTALMGATLPLLAAASVERDTHLGSRVSFLYGVNALGATAGAFACGFALIPNLGMTGTSRVAVALNLVVGLAALLLRRVATAGPGASASTIADGAPAPLNRLVVGSVGLTGFVSLGCQILWSRSLPFTFEFLSSTTYSYSALLGVFIGGLALGSGAAGLVADRQRAPVQFYGTVLTLLGLSILVSVLSLLGGAGGNILGSPLDLTDQTLNMGRASANLILQTAMVLGLPTFLMGMALPLAVRAVASARDVGPRVGQLYALNTVGGIVGVLTVTFALTPTIGITGSLILLAVLDTALGLWVLAGEKALKPLASLGALGACALLATTWVAAHGAGFQHLATMGMRELHYEEGPVATIGVYEDAIKERNLFVDGHGVAGTAEVMQTDQKSLAHIPMMLVPDAKRALSVGFGSGGASYSFLLHPQLEHVDLVEIAPEIARAARYLTRANHGFLEAKDPRYRIITDDARAYLQYTNVQYDIIATDCTDLRYKLNANLYDREYFAAARKALTPQGVVVVWMPLGGLSDELFRLTLRTFMAEFPETSVHYMHNVLTEYVLLVGWRDKVQLDYRTIVRRLENPRVRADLAEIHLDNAFKLLATFVTAGPKLRAYVGDGPLNLEDEPRLEFAAPKQGYNDGFILNNIARLFAHRDLAAHWLVPGSMTDDELHAFAPYEAAAPYIVRGLIHENRRRYPQALADYRRAQSMTPDDRGLDSLLEFPVLQQWAESGNPVAGLDAASLLLEQGKADRATRLVAQASEALSHTSQVDPTVRKNLEGRITTLRQRLGTKNPPAAP